MIKLFPANTYLEAFGPKKVAKSSLKRKIFRPDARPTLFSFCPAPAFAAFSRCFFSNLSFHGFFSLSHLFYPKLFLASNRRQSACCGFALSILPRNPSYSRMLFSRGSIRLCLTAHLVASLKLGLITAAGSLFAKRTDNLFGSSLF